MLSHLIHKRIILLCCIFTCLTTFYYTQDSFASSNSYQIADDTRFNKEIKKPGFFSKILDRIFSKKNSTKSINKTDHSILTKKLLRIENRILRVSQQKYNVEHSYGNKQSLAVKSTQLKKILSRLTKQRNLIASQITTLEKDKNLITKNKTISLPEIIKTNTVSLNKPRPTLPDTNPIKAVFNIMPDSFFNNKKSPVMKVASKDEVKPKNEIDKCVADVEREKTKNRKTSFTKYLNNEVEKSTLPQSASILNNTPDKIVFTRSNKEIKFAKEISFIEESKERVVTAVPGLSEKLMLPKASTKFIEQIGDEVTIETNLPVDKVEITEGNDATILDKIEGQIREMVVDGTTDEIKMALNDGNSVGIIRVLVEKNITRQDLTNTERDTINDYIAILGKIGNKDDIKFLSDIKTINMRLDDYYTHNIYTAIWKLKKKQGSNRIETREDFDDAIDYISYIYNYYKTNTNENMQLYSFEVDFLSEIIDALSDSSYTQESVPLLSKLIEFKNKDFAHFVNKCIDKIFNSMDIENSERVVADFKP